MQVSYWICSINWAVIIEGRHIRAVSLLTATTPTITLVQEWEAGWVCPPASFTFFPVSYCCHCPQHPGCPKELGNQGCLLFNCCCPSVARHTIELCAKIWAHCGLSLLRVMIILAI